MSATRLSPSRRREDIRAWWAAHMKEQQDSGQARWLIAARRVWIQSTLTLWKRKLREPRGSGETIVEPARLVPVLVRANKAVSPSKVAREKRLSEPASIVALRLSLGNGISLSLEVATASIPALVARAGWAAMLRVAPGSRIFMAVKPVVMRRSFDGLCATITEALGGDPLSATYFCFVVSGRIGSKRSPGSDGTRDLVQRLEKGKYKWPTRDAASIEMTEHELALLLDGVDFKRIRRLPAFSLHAPPP